MVDVQGELLGGDLTPDQPAAFCLLDGFEDDSNIRFHIPIRTLPALLGRQHDNDNPCFVSIGSAKAISRIHVRIDYGIQGGYFSTKEDGGVVFEADSDYDHLPPRGVFVLKLMSKNRILVNQQRVEQGEMVLLETERAIRIGPLALYFFPPQDGSSSGAVAPEPAPSSTAEVPPPSKKRWSIDVSSAIPTAVVKTQSSSSHSQQQSNLFDTMSWEELWSSHETAETDRRQQIIAAALAVQAVRAAARALGRPEVSRSELTDWITTSPLHAPFQQRLMERMEPKSYQACITKALVRSGFERGTGSGRFIKWQVPPQFLGDGGEDVGEEGPLDEGADEDDEQDDEEGEEDEDDEEGVEDGANVSEPEEDDGDEEPPMQHFAPAGGMMPS